VKSLLNAGNKLLYAESMTSSRDSMIIVVFTGAARAKTVKDGTNRYARGQQHTAKTVVRGWGKFKELQEWSAEGRGGGLVARRAMHEQRNKILSWLWAATGACLYVLRKKMRNDLRVWLLWL